MATTSGIGSARWLAPETSSYPPIFDQKSDVFSLGLVLWEISSRQIPFNDIANDHQVPYYFHVFLALIFVLSR